MNFLIDAQLPARLARCLQEAGHDVLHTRDLAAANSTPDAEIIRLADAQERFVVTKDADFVHSFYVSGQPRRLLLISTGNITNIVLEALLLAHLDTLIATLETASFVELSRTVLIVHV